MLTNRPLVIPDTSRVEIDFSAADERVYLTLDGQIGFELGPKDRVMITKSENKVRLSGRREKHILKCCEASCGGENDKTVGGRRAGCDHIGRSEQRPYFTLLSTTRVRSSAGCAPPEKLIELLQDFVRDGVGSAA